MKQKVLKNTMALLLGLSLVSFQALAQRQVTGKVIDENGDAIPGASVIVKGTTTGTITDFDGAYTLNVSDDAVLVFSFVGYQTTEQAVGARSVIDVNMASDLVALEEIVVVGYGTQERKEITSSVASISSENFNKGAVQDPTQLLQGKAAGLTISRPGGDPNENFTIRLRGLSTVGAQTEPLIVIDGVIGGSLNSVDPTDIESIDILKDGSAAAIYGTRGSSGVILITTKKGKAGQTQVDYNVFTSVEVVADELDVLSVDEYRGLTSVGINVPDRGGDGTDWVDAVSQDAWSQVHNLSFSGGTESTTYRASFNFRDVEGTLKGTGFTSLNSRLNLTQRALNDRMTFTAQIANTTRNSNPTFNTAWRNAVIGNPTTPIFAPNNEDNTPEDNDGYFEGGATDEFNPVALINQNTRERKQQTLLTSARVEYDFSDFFDGFRAAVFYSQQRQNQLDGAYFGKNARFRGFTRNGLAERQEELLFNQLAETTINYDKSVGDLDIAFLGGYSWQEFTEERFGAQGGNFLTDAFGFNAFENSQDFQRGTGVIAGQPLPFGTTVEDLDGSPAPQGKEANKLIAFFGRINLNYKGTYFLSASVRREGSTRFGDGNKWGSFPAVSAGVTISNLVDIPSVDNLKFRASYGVTGNQPPFNRLSQPLIGPTGGSFLVDGQFNPSFGPSSNPNPDLKWERKSEIDLGLDFSILEGRLNGSIDWYTRTTDDLILLFDVPVPPNLFPRTWINVGELDNTGIEIQASFNAINTGDFSWTPAVNFSTFKTELAEFPDETRLLSNAGAPGLNGTPLARVTVGQEVGQLWGPRITGIDENGEWVAEDIDGDGDTSPGQEGNATIIGNGLPDGEYGINNSFTYKNWDLNMFFRGAYGHDIMNMFQVFHGVPAAAGQRNVTKEALDRLEDGLAPTVAADVNSEFVENGSFLRFDNFTIGYNVPVSNNNNLRNLRFYFSGNNVAVFSGYTGVDPEVRFADIGESFNGSSPSRTLRPDPLVAGIDRRATFVRTRTWTFGASIGF